jgi:hypothetical protein
MSRVKVIEVAKVAVNAIPPIRPLLLLVNDSVLPLIPTLPPGAQ